MNIRRTWRLCYRFIWLLVHIGIGVMIALLCQYVLRFLSHYEIRRNRLVTWWFSHFCHIFRIRIHRSGIPTHAPSLIAANHISWLDIPVLGAYCTGSFVSKAEIRSWPVVGFLALAADTVFIERGHRQSFETVVATITEFLHRGRSVFIFPEGTTSNGQQVLKFRRRLFNAALHAQVPIQPVTLRYLQNGQPHPVIPYVGDDNLWTNLLGVLKEPFIDVSIHYAEILPPSGNETELARQCWERVAANLCD